jgi:hypothetical protein
MLSSIIPIINKQYTRFTEPCDTNRSFTFKDYQISCFVKNRPKGKDRSLKMNSDRSEGTNYRCEATRTGVLQEPFLKDAHSFHNEFIQAK